MYRAKNSCRQTRWRYTGGQNSIQLSLDFRGRVIILSLSVVWGSGAEVAQARTKSSSTASNPITLYQLSQILPIEYDSRGQCQCESEWVKVAFFKRLAHDLRKAICNVPAFVEIYCIHRIMHHRESTRHLLHGWTDVSSEKLKNRLVLLAVDKFFFVDVDSVAVLLLCIILVISISYVNILKRNVVI